VILIEYNPNTKKLGRSTAWLSP